MSEFDQNKLVRLVNDVGEKEFGLRVLDSCLNSVRQTSRARLWSRDGDASLSSYCNVFVLHNVSSFLSRVIDDHVVDNEEIDFIMPDFEQTHIQSLLKLVHLGGVSLERFDDIQALQSLCSCLGISNLDLEQPCKINTITCPENETSTSMKCVEEQGEEQFLTQDEASIDEPPRKVRIEEENSHEDYIADEHSKSKQGETKANDERLILKLEANLSDVHSDPCNISKVPCDSDAVSTIDNSYRNEEEDGVVEDADPLKEAPTTVATTTKSSSKSKPRRRVYMSDLSPSELSCCGKQFSHLYKLKLHQLTHSSSPPFVCSLCGKGFNNKYKMRTHEKNHPNKTEKQALDLVKAKDRSKEDEDEITRDKENFKCDGCGRSDFSSRAELKRHLNKEHPSLKPFLCSQCGKSFRREKALLQHVAKSCGTKSATTSTSFSCSLCSMSMSSASELRKHMLSVHKQSSAKKEVCDECGVECASKKNLRIHKRVAHDASQATLKHACNLCNKRFLKFAYLQDHYNRFHCDVKLFSCSLCPKRFATQQDLGRHVKATHKVNADGEKSGFKCETCSRVFTHRATFAQHVRSHANVRPYKCVPCDKRFVAYGALKKHQLSHQRQGDRTRIFSAPRGTRGAAVSYIDIDPGTQQNNVNVNTALNTDDGLNQLNNFFVDNTMQEQMAMSQQSNLLYSDDPYISHPSNNLNGQMGFEQNIVDCFYENEMQSNYWLDNNGAMDTQQQHLEYHMSGQEEHAQYLMSQGMHQVQQESFLQQPSADDQMESESIAMAIMGLFSDQQDDANQVQHSNNLNSDYLM